MKTKIDFLHCFIFDDSVSSPIKKIVHKRTAKFIRFNSLPRHLINWETLNKMCCWYNINILHFLMHKPLPIRIQWFRKRHFIEFIYFDFKLYIFPFSFDLILILILIAFHLFIALLWVFMVSIFKFIIYYCVFFVSNNNKNAF